MKKRGSLVEKIYNQRIAEEMRKKREEAGLTQKQIMHKIAEREKAELQRRGVSEEDLDYYLYGEKGLPDEVRKRLKKVGIDIEYVQHAASFTSQCENGEVEIKASFYKLWLEICEEEISSKKFSHSAKQK